MEVSGISIIVPCFNSDVYLLELVKSVKLLELKIPWEIVVVDDCPTDLKTRQALRDVAGIGNVKVIRNETNLGSQASRNAGIKNSKYPYILPIDSDDKLNTERNVLEKGNYIERAIDVLSKNDNVAFVHCAVKMFGDFDGYTISPYPLTEELVAKKHHVITNIVYRKKDAIDAGMYAEDIKKWQDWSFGVALLNSRLERHKKNEIVYFEENYVLFRNHASGTRLSTQKSDELEMTYQTVKKYPSLFKKYYVTEDMQKLSEQVLANKPSKLIDLLYVARNNMEVARQIIKERHFELINVGIPKVSP